MLQHKCKGVRVNMEDEELVKIFNPTLKMRKTILFFLIVVINGLTWIVSDIGLDTCARGRWRVEVSKMEMNQSLGSYIIIIDLINLGSNFVRPIEPINKLMWTQSKLLQYTLKKNREVLNKEGCSFWWSFGLEHFV